VLGIIKTTEHTLRILGHLFFFFFLVGFLGRGLGGVMPTKHQGSRHEPPG
jgi:hypothetical protein